jgi:replicative DNA helicase
VLWKALLAMHAAGQPTDTVAVVAHLNGQGLLGRVGGLLAAEVFHIAP